MHIWGSVFGWKALFRWDALAVITTFVVGAGLAVLAIDWFPYHLLIAQVFLSIGGVLCAGKIIGHAIETDDTVRSRSIFAVVLTLFCIWITGWTVVTIQHHKQANIAEASGPKLRPSTNLSDPAHRFPALQVPATPPAKPESTPKHERSPHDGAVMGSDNTTYGNVPFRSITGNRNTFVGPTDSHGNVNIPVGTAVGYGAKAGATDIAIGVNAGAGFQPLQQMHCETGSLCNQGSTVNAPQTVNNYGPPTPPPLTLSFSQEQARSSDPNLPYEVLVTVHVNTDWSPVSLKVLCTGPIEELGMQLSSMNVRSGTGDDPTIGILSFDFPVITPKRPLKFVIRSKSRLSVKDVVRVEQ